MNTRLHTPNRLNRRVNCPETSLSREIRPLARPVDHPQRPEPVLTIALVAHHRRDRLSTRHWTRQFRKAWRRAADRHLNHLANENWLRIKDHSHGPVAHHYALGTRSQCESDKWIALGHALYGPGGLLAPFVNRPAFGRSLLGPSGALVAGVLLRGGSYSQASITYLLGGLLCRQTVGCRLKYLVEQGLVVCDGDGQYLCVGGFWEVLEALEVSSGACEACLEQDRLFVRERALFLQELRRRGRSPVRGLKRVRCVFGCGGLADTAEHFPPRHWGCRVGDNRFVWQACRSCNSRQGRRIQFLPVPAHRDGTSSVGGERLAVETYLAAFRAYLQGDTVGLDRAYRLTVEHEFLWNESLPPRVGPYGEAVSVGSRELLPVAA